MIPTLKVLNDLLRDEDLECMSFGKGVTKGHCETYGKKTFAYFGARNMVQRARIEDMLEAAGVQVNRRYSRKSGGCTEEYPALEVRVSYLRAHGWNE